MRMMNQHQRCQRVMSNKNILPLPHPKWRGVVTLVLLFLSLGSFAQDEFGTDLSVAVEKKFTKSLEGELSVDYRLQDIGRKPYSERIDLGAGIGYKIINTKKFDFKVNAGFEYIRQVKPTELEYTKKENLKVAYRKSFDRTRTSAGLSASFKPNKRWTFSLKETVQYNHYASFSRQICKYDKKIKDGEIYYNYDENASWLDNTEAADDFEEKSYEAKDRFVLRNKLNVKYNIKHSIFSPYASCDYGCGLNYSTNKWKFTAGTEIEFSKQHNMDVYYRYQTENDDDEPNGHILGVGYIIKY